jgi:uncharacterized protein (TIGR00730 family)
MTSISSICVFCGSNPGQRPEFAAIAARTGATIARRGLTLVYGGGGIGLMGVLADAALAAGGRVVGVIPGYLLDREVGHSSLSELEVVETMAQRKVRMGARSDAYLTLPGGLGTLDELTEAWTWSQLGLEDKPSGLLNALGYFDPLLEFLDRAVVEGFLPVRHRRILRVDTDLERLLDCLCCGAGHDALAS